MCGIFAYIGNKNCTPIIIEGLKRLEYRGYDSAGISVLAENKNLLVTKMKGKVSELEQALSKAIEGDIGVGHTRWATHGVPNHVNAHPHLNQTKDIALVHNGIIENYRALKSQLQNKGYKFISDTDTEVLLHLIDEIWKTSSCDFETAVRLSLKEVVGAYGICVISSREPNKIIVARNGSPILIGIGENEFYVSSDAASIVAHVHQVIYLRDGEISTITKDSYSVKTIDNVVVPKEIEELTLSISEIEKSGFPTFMLKEIFEQPESILNSIRGRASEETGSVLLGGIKPYINQIIHAKQLIICGCGTSWHASLLGEYLIEYFARIPVQVEYASEFRYRNPILTKDDVVIFVSQSGETADTLAALKIAKEKGALTIGVCNVVGSNIARNTDCGMYIHAGPEIGVASTKAYTAQVSVLVLFALMLAEARGTLSIQKRKVFIKELYRIPEKITKILEQKQLIQKIAEDFYHVSNFLYLGRGFNFPTVLEGALKLKEISYIHAEGYPAAEMKHGPISLIDDNMPVVFIAMKDLLYSKIISNMEEIRARNGKIIAIASDGDEEISHYSDYVIRIPRTAEAFYPLLTAIPLQLLAYYIAELRGCNVDQPRNLAKSVTVE